MYELYDEENLFTYLVNKTKHKTMKITFSADRVQLKTFANPDDIRVLLYTGIYEWDKLKDLPKLQQNKAVYKITIEPEIEEID